MILTQFTAVSYAAKDVVGSVSVYADSAWVHTEEGNTKLEGQEVGSVTASNSRSSAVHVGDQPRGTPEDPTEHGDVSFTVDGDLTNSNDNWMAGVWVEIDGGKTDDGSAANMTLNINGNVTSTQTGDHNGTNGIYIDADGAKEIDQSVTIKVNGNEEDGTSGDIKAVNKSDDYNGTYGISMDNDGSDTDNDTAMSATVNAGSVTADSGKSGNAKAIDIDLTPNSTTEKAEVNIKGDVTAKTADGKAYGVESDISSYTDKTDSSVTVKIGKKTEDGARGTSVPLREKTTMLQVYTMMYPRAKRRSPWREMLKPRVGTRPGSTVGALRKKVLSPQRSAEM